MSKKILVSANPHIRSEATIEKIMYDVVIALLPACIAGVYFFGIRALITIVLSVTACVSAEWLFEKIAKKPITIRDGSAVVTGLLLAMNLPYTVPFWLPVVGGFFAIIIVKMLFGGLGHNFMNPALAARAFLLTSYPVQMTTWSIDATSGATPLGRMEEGGFIPASIDYFNALFGFNGGSLGEVCTIAIILGGIYLIVRGVISWRTPVSFIAAFFLLASIIKRPGFDASYPLYELLTGGLMLGAFFMATDYASAPIHPKGQFIMGIGCGVLAILIRFYGGYPEGVCYSILIMNLVVPYIDKITVPHVYGGGK
ncbi:RnfABCDGE type electron transport complex subunit D [Lacrimispora sphenoides]|uniref:Ion-translocating oxidoreductase complex subunit D n=1 Tax=Lacrimispora sphenoides JCM 1415 TaxID=1297793 RepID=A0ABY1CEJ2_9FIRM|nr:RnfABCDGE type electron transport complex subunit D [Lacrimispora sphenoides]SET98030.1 electron transport complex protein RnfD [[Clostridium] sphenoides JCM 1415]SUY52931.1 RnfABCDGE type electron transport complex subunit D [Lacrimispora sphenoides]